MDIFFGRNEEVDELYEMVFQSDLILIYGASGTGKSSLIQCGLASRFQSHDWLAMNIRRGSNLNISFERALQEAGGTAEMPDDELGWLEDGPDRRRRHAYNGQKIIATRKKPEGHLPETFQTNLPHF